MRRQLLGVCALCAIAAVQTGCSTRLLRETVYANTESMFGVTIAQNAQTQLYELKAGFARHELFMVPTDKIIQYDRYGNQLPIPAADATAGRSSRRGASVTANVLGEIQVGGTSRGGTGNNGIEIYQRLAVGDIAVRSGAAIALMANDDKIAKAAAMAANPELMAAVVTAERKAKLDQIQMLRKATSAPVTVTIDEASKTFIDGRALEIGRAHV